MENQPDAEYIEAMLATRAWRLVSDRMQVAYKKACEALKVAEGNDVYRVQGQVKAYEVALGIPHILIKEAKQ